MFEDRFQAGQKLADKIEKEKLSLKSRESIVLALPRGGVVVAKEVAKKMELPLDIIVTRKIGHPLNSEYAIGAVSSHKLFLNPHEKVDENYLKKETEKQRREIQRRLIVYRGKRPSPKILNKNVILVDDGIATGLTIQAAIEEIKFHKPKEIILAVPVAPPETFDKLKEVVDRTIILELEPVFFAVGQFYHHFEEVGDKEVKKLLG